MKKKKILITGFPHTGTSILKSKMGECENVFEVIKEYFSVRPDDILASGEKEFVLVKSPIIPIEIRANKLIRVTLPNTEYSDYIIIFVIRNPWNVFTSIIKDGKNPLNKLQPNEGPEYHIKLDEYIAAANFFIEARNANYKNVYAIKYEDFFEDDNKKLFELMDRIGLSYSDDIFKTKTKDYIHSPDIAYKNIDASSVSYSKNRLEMRTWQINQEFKNMNGEVDIPDELDKLLKESPIVQELGYTDPRLTH